MRESRAVMGPNDDGRRLRLLSWGFSLTSVTCFLGAEWRELSKEIHLALLVAGILSFVWSGPLVSLSGMATHGIDKFKMYQPFEGGVEFMAMQALGWSMYSICCGLCLLVVLNPQLTADLHLSSIGLLSFAASGLLNFSLDTFHAPSSDDAKRLTLSKGAQGSIVIVLVSFLVVVALCALELFPDAVDYSVALDVAVFLNIACAVVLHVWCGAFALQGSGFVIWQPFRGGPEFVLLQALGWAFLGAQLFLYFNASKLSFQRFSGGSFLFGALGLASIVILAGSHVFFRPSGKLPKISLNREEASSLKSAKFSQSLLGLSFISFFYSTYSILFLEMEAPLATSTSSRITSLSMICGPVLAHAAGSSMCTRDGYPLFRPMSGGLSHVLSQAFGWLFYGIFLFSSISYTAWWERNEMMSPLAVISNALLATSVLVYHDVPIATGAPGRNSSKSHTATGSLLEGDSFTAGNVVAAVAMIFHATAEISVSELDFVSLKVGSASLKISLLLWALASVLLYVATFKTRIFLWRPFQGPALFVMCEAVSWTLFVTAALGDIIVSYALLSEHNDAEPIHLSGWSILVGLAHLSSFSLLRYGAVEFRLGVMNKKYDTQSNAARHAFAAPVTTGLSHYLALLCSHVSPVLIFFAEKSVAQLKTPSLVHHITGGSTFTFLLGISMTSLNAVCIQAWVGPRSIANFRAIQPFQGGPRFVLLQAIAWFLFASLLVAALIAVNVGIENIPAVGVMLSLSLASYVMQVTLISSLREFDLKDGRYVQLDAKYGAALAGILVAVFAVADFAVIRFGLSKGFMDPIITCAWVALCISIPLTSMFLSGAEATKLLAEGTTSSQGITSFAVAILRHTKSPVLIILGVTLWTFTVFLGVLLLINSLARSEAIPALFTTAVTGTTSVVSYAFLKVASISSPQEILNDVPIALATTVTAWFAVRVFVWTILPLLRAFLDYPMVLYARMMKRSVGWISPDGLQALRNVSIERDIVYGPLPGDILDRLRPLDIKNCFLQTCPERAEIPVLYCHGGGHLCVSKELLLHSVTPFCRAGVTVYALDYPLSPETRYPTAVLCVLRAILWVQQNHCGNPFCRPKCSYIETVKHAHECGPSCPRTVHPAKEKKCQHCGETLGTDQVNLLGDSAGGNLVAMAAALLSNHRLFEDTVKLGGKPFEDLKDVPFGSYPSVERLGILYGLLGRNTPYKVPSLIADIPGGNWLWNTVCHVGISFVFQLYDNAVLSNISTITDLEETQLEHFPPETMLICGANDPLLPCNIAAERFLTNLGHKCKLHVVPGTHAFHGFPSNWCGYLGYDWRTNALPSTLHLLRFFVGDTLKEDALQEEQSKESILADYSPLIIFPVFFFVLPFVIVFLLSSS